MYILPGISDHEVVVGQISCPKHQVADLPPRKMYLYIQGNYEAMVDELFNYLSEFQELSLSLDMNSLWNTFKFKHLLLTCKYVLSRDMSNKCLKNKHGLTNICVD